MPQGPSSDPKARLITAAVAAGSLGSLVILTTTGIFSLVPAWVAVLIVVLELVVPFFVFWILKRAEQRR